MVTSTSGVPSANTITDFSLAGATPAQSAESFAQQFLTAIEGYLGGSGNSSQLQINIQSAGQNSAGSSQFVVTVQDTPASAVSSSATSAQAPPSGSTKLDTSIFTSTAASAAIASGTAAPAAKTETTASSSAVAGTTFASSDVETPSAAQLAQMTPTEAYWANQPPAVQALQNMPADQRASAAQALALQGYTIDVPIMVWGQDPLATMLTREADGYTWVPSAMQADVAAAPGINYSSSSNYDPKSAPAGSILVSTAFADGTNGQDPAAVGWGTQSTS